MPMHFGLRSMHFKGKYQWKQHKKFTKHSKFDLHAALEMATQLGTVLDGEPADDLGSADEGEILNITFID